MESFYFGFGEGDAYVIIDLPDNVAAAAVGLAVSATGLASTKTIVLLTPEEIDKAAKMQVDYKATTCLVDPERLRRNGATRLPVPWGHPHC